MVVDLSRADVLKLLERCSFRFDYDGKQVTRTNIKGLIYVHLQFSHGQLYVALSLSRATDMRKLSMYFILS